AMGYQCVCQPGFSGATCEVSDPCSSAPCQNKAHCHSQSGDFVCTCSDEYEGKTCSELRDHCKTNECHVIDSCTVAVATNDSRKGAWHISSSVCGPHGRCLSLPAGNFSCSCDPGFTGAYCHETQNSSCDSGPCVNGGTCVGSGDAYTCICKDGWEGLTCGQNADDCNPHPCALELKSPSALLSDPDSLHDEPPYNRRGPGVRGPGWNWFRCECAAGFAGPDCRISESWEPGGGGGAGVRDQRVPLPLSSGPGRAAVPRCHWDEECNGCQCIHGNVRCSKVRCGRRPCLLPRMLSGPAEPGPAPCPAAQECVEHRYLTCFAPPCHSWGVCSAPGPPGPDPDPDTRCEPNSGYLDNSCVRITLIFRREQVPQGTTVEKICSELRFLPVTQTLARDHTLCILCDRSYSNTDAVEVAMRPNSTVMLAVVEVKVETVTAAMPVDYLVPVLVAVFGVLWVLCIAVCVWWTRKRNKERREAELAARDRTVNNQLQPLTAAGHAPGKDNRHKEAKYGSGKLAEDPEEQEAEEEEQEEEEAEEAAREEEEEEEKKRRNGEKPSRNGLRSKAGLLEPRGIVGSGGLICTTHGAAPVKGPHRTAAYGPKDNRCKNLNAGRLSEDIRDHYV
ncbi:hypothetical protein CRUP_035229, partial [Coryphaenoides rupestris]